MGNSNSTSGLEIKNSAISFKRWWEGKDETVKDDLLEKAIKRDVERDSTSEKM